MGKALNVGVRLYAYPQRTSGFPLVEHKLLKESIELNHRDELCMRHYDWLVDGSGSESHCKRLSLSWLPAKLSDHRNEK